MDGTQMVSRLLQLTDLIASTEKVVADKRYELSQIKHAIEIQSGELLLSILPKEARNEDQRKAIINRTLKHLVDKKNPAQREYDYARLKLNRYRGEFEVLLEALRVTGADSRTASTNRISQI